MGVWYITREQLKTALGISSSGHIDAQLDRAIEAASRAVEGYLHRRFYPEVATRYFDWPNTQYARTWRLWLDENEVISLTSLTSGGEALSASDYFLEPVNSGPPFESIEVDLDSQSSFGQGNTGTHQRKIAATGTFGYQETWSPAGNLAEALDASETGVQVTDSSALGTGSLLKVESEYMLVTGFNQLSTGDANTTALTASVADDVVNVTSGAAFFAGEVITLGSEQMLIESITGNSLIVKRAFNATTLATHAMTTTIYAPRDLVVTRGALGTTAATHNTALSVSVFVFPGGVNALTAMYAIRQYMGESSGYSGASNTTQGKFDPSVLEILEREVRITYGRKARTLAV